jgi:hypothetical protein
MATKDERRRAVLKMAEEKLNALSADERAAMLELAKPFGRTIAHGHRDILVTTGLVRATLGDLVLTGIGRMAVSIARKKGS